MKDKTKIPSVAELLIDGEDVAVGSKLTAVQFGELGTLQLHSKHSIDKGSSILVELNDLNTLVDVLKEYAERYKKSGNNS